MGEVSGRGHVVVVLAAVSGTTDGGSTRAGRTHVIRAALAVSPKMGDSQRRRNVLVMSRERSSGDGRRRSVAPAPATRADPPARAEYPSPTHAPEYQFMLARLREARLALRLTQAEVGRRLGRTDQFVSKSETGERRIDPIDLWRLARVYNRPVDDFLPPAVPESS